MICCVLFLLLSPAFPNQIPLIAVFRVTEEPAVIVRGDKRFRTNGEYFVRGCRSGAVDPGTEQALSPPTRRYGMG